MLIAVVVASKIDWIEFVSRASGGKWYLLHVHSFYLLSFLYIRVYAFVSIGNQKKLNWISFHRNSIEHQGESDICFAGWGEDRAVQCISIQFQLCNVVHWNMFQSSVLQWNTIYCSAVHFNEIHLLPVQSIVLHCNIQLNVLQWNLISGFVQWDVISCSVHTAVQCSVLQPTGK